MPDDRTPTVANRITGGVFLHTVVQGATVTVNLPPEVPSARAGLPPAGPGFTGRDLELDLLLELLDPEAEDGLPTVCSVVGLAGVGKTALAVQAAHAARRRGWYPGGVLFVDLQGYDDRRRVEPTDALYGLLQALGLHSEHIPPQLPDRTRLYRSVLSAFAEQGQPLLVLLDNASGSEHARPLLPGDRRTRTVVTSRQVLSTLDSRVLGLDVLDEQSALDLLGRMLAVAHGSDARLTQDARAAAELARLCGYLPLALRIVGALLIHDPRKPLAVLLEDLADERVRLDALAVDDLGVRAAFDLSYQALSPRAARLFCLLALGPGTELSTATAAVLSGDEQRACRRLLESLAQAHLVEGGTAYGRWRLHDLVRSYAAEQLNLHVPAQERGAAVDRLVSHYRETVRTQSTRPRDAWHTQELYDWLRSEGPDFVTTYGLAAQAGRPDAARRLTDEVMSLTDAVFESAVDRLYWRWFFFRGTRRFQEAFLALEQHLVVIQPARSVRLEDPIVERVFTTLNDISTPEEAVRSLGAAAAALNVAGEVSAEGGVLVTLGLALLQGGRAEEACEALSRAVEPLRRAGPLRSADVVHVQALLDSVRTGMVPLEQDWWSQRHTFGRRR